MIVLALLQALACNLTQGVEHTHEAVLSNGATIPLPTLAQDFDALSIYGSVDADAVADLLEPQDLEPVRLLGRGVALLSAFDYHTTDVGAFSEVYYVVFATRKDVNPFTTLWSFFRALRWNPQGPSDKLAMYHLRVHSSHEDSRLMSEEVWGIPAHPGHVEVMTQEEPGFILSQGGETLLETRWSHRPWFPNLLGKNMAVYAVGPRLNGTQAWSPVVGCGSTKISPWKDSDVLVAPHGELGRLLEVTGFNPIQKELGLGHQAIQYDRD